ncbi:hypothetical protein PIB30_114100, partial [Stylosanthes scabra]|nr:hypothetical protein [Stylosanthes scabra]
IKFFEDKNGSERNEGCDDKDLGDEGIGDPRVVRTKGTGRGNEPLGSRGVKRRKCSNCGELGHRRTKCPNPSKSNPNCSQDTEGNPMSQSQGQRRVKTSQVEKGADFAGVETQDNL